MIENLESEARDALSQVMSLQRILPEEKWFLNCLYRGYSPKLLTREKPEIILLGEDIPWELTSAAGVRTRIILGGSLETTRWSDAMLPRDADPISRSACGWLMNPHFNLTNKMDEMKHMPHDGGCPGSRMMQLGQNTDETPIQTGKPVSRLGQWPCQIKLVPTQAPFFNGAKLLIAADCTAYAYANLHEDFMKGRITIIGCPKLDAVDYTEKLTAIIRDNDIKSVTIVRMEVPCCGGLQRSAETALQASGKFIPWQVVTISRDGRILD